MLATTLGCTYLGATLCYVASPKSAARIGPTGTSRPLRLGGALLLALGLAMAVGTRPVGEGILVWLSMAMAAFSLLVVAAPLVDRFVPVTGALAIIVGLLGLWI